MPKYVEIKIQKAEDLPVDWFKRGTSDEKERIEVQKKVEPIIAVVKKNGDSALIDFTEKFDKTKLTPKTIRVTKKEIEEAYGRVSKSEIAALMQIKQKLTLLGKAVIAKADSETCIEGVKIKSTLRPIESVGCYVPGGKAVYPSTLLMTVVPAKIAGVKRVVVCSPPSSQGSIHPLILVAADICEVDEVYKLGGVQAIAALSYGTETIAPVKKIVGPGNSYVTTAKILVSQDVAIDLPAGPSEVLVLADESANPKLVAADMVSQAEHGVTSVAGLITTSESLANETLSVLNCAVNEVERRETVISSLNSKGFIIISSNEDQMIDLANTFAPEHLELMTKKPWLIAEKINTAGLVLVGNFIPVAFSDYAAGTNHVLPTGGAAAVWSGLSVLDFTRRMDIAEGSKESLLKLSGAIEALTKAEDLPNHYKAVTARLET